MRNYRFCLQFFDFFFTSLVLGSCRDEGRDVPRDDGKIIPHKWKKQTHKHDVKQVTKMMIIVGYASEKMKTPRK